jgi:hypothetical protein
MCHNTPTDEPIRLEVARNNEHYGTIWNSSLPLRACGHLPFKQKRPLLSKRPERVVRVQLGHLLLTAFLLLLQGRTLLAVLRVIAAIAHSAAALLVGFGGLGIATAALAVLAALGAFFAAGFAISGAGAHLAIFAAAFSILAAIHGFALCFHLFAARTCGFLVSSGSGCSLGDQRDRHDQHQYEYEYFRFHDFLSMFFRCAASVAE